MTIHELISRAYSAFNRRDIDAALVLMSDDVSWPKASEGGRVVGKQEIRDYWSRQWAEFDPWVEVLEVLESAPTKVEVKVRQLVRDRKGTLLSDTDLWHIYSVDEGLITRMDIAGENLEGPSSAFSGSTPRQED